MGGGSVEQLKEAVKGALKPGCNVGAFLIRIGLRGSFIALQGTLRNYLGSC